MLNEDYRDLCQPEGARRLEDPVAMNDCSVLTDKDRLADAELFDAGPDTRDLRGFRPANAMRRPTQLVDRQTAAYEPGDIEDRYETRLRAMIDAKLKGEGIDVEAAPEPVATNVIDLMAALRRSIADDDEAKTKTKAETEATPPTKAKTPKPAGAPTSTRKRVS